MPLLHELPPLHCVPQAPQLALSVIGLVHCSPQSVVPFGQTHWLPAHVRPAGQALPHAPQFRGLLVVSTHARSQFVSVPQSGAQAPVRQTSGAGQLVPQVPQFAGSAVTSTQLAPHCESPVAHVHIPLVQTVPGMQTVLHMPQ
jgi:hypothetical protein